MRALASALALLVVGCGYRLAAGVRLPPGVRSISVAVFENDTSEPQAGPVFAQAVAGALLEQRPRQSGEDAVVHGKVLTLRAVPSGLGPGNVVGSWRLSATVAYRVVAGGRVIYEEPALSWEEDYLPGQGALDTEIAQRLAMERASRALARELVMRLAALGE